MRSLPFFSALIIVFLATVSQAWAQTEAENCQDNRGVCAYQKPLKDLLTVVKENNETKNDIALRNLLAPDAVPRYLVLALSEDSLFDNVVNAWERARVDKQVGTSAKGTGSTDLVSRPSTPELLGLAVQLGALTETVSGTTATFNANAYGSYQAIVGRPGICLLCTDTAWKNLNFSASFDLSRQGTKQVATSGVANSTTPSVGTVQLPQSSRQLSSVTVRYDIYNPLDPRSKEFKKGWSAAFQKHQKELADAAQDLDAALLVILNPLIKDKALKSLEDDYTSDILKDATANNFTRLRSDFESYFKKLSELAHNDISDLDQKLAAAASAFARYSQINYTAVQEARGKPQFTAEYLYNHPVTQPDTHDFKLIYGYTPKSTTGSLCTLNLASGIYGGAM